MVASIAVQQFPKSYASVIDRPEGKKGHNAWEILEVMRFIQKTLQEGMAKHLETSKGFTHITNQIQTKIVDRFSEMAAKNEKIFGIEKLREKNETIYKVIFWTTMVISVAMMAPQLTLLSGYVTMVLVPLSIAGGALKIVTEEHNKDIAHIKMDVTRVSELLNKDSVLTEINETVVNVTNSKISDIAKSKANLMQILAQILTVLGNATHTAIR